MSYCIWLALGHKIHKNWVASKQWEEEYGFGAAVRLFIWLPTFSKAKPFQHLGHVNPQVHLSSVEYTHIWHLNSNFRFQSIQSTLISIASQHACEMGQCHQTDQKSGMTDVEMSEEILVYQVRGSLGGQTCCTLAASGLSGGLILVNAKIDLCSNGTHY